MQDRDEADFGAEMFGIGGDGEHGLGAGFEQEVVDHRFVVIGDIGDFAWQGEDDMELGHWQELGLAVGKPIPCRCSLTFGAVSIPTTIKRDHRMIAVLAGCDFPACSRIAAKVGPAMPDLRSFAPADRDMATKRRGAAALDGAHHLELAETDMAGVGGTPRGPVVAEDIRDLQGWPGHWSRGYFGFLRFLASPFGSDKRSSGLSILAIMPVATRV